jgi:hypothetical protein
MKRESLGVWMDKFLKVGKEYTVFSETGNTFEGVYMGLEYGILHFAFGEDNIYIKPKSVVMIKEGRLQ